MKSSNPVLSRRGFGRGNGSADLHSKRPQTVAAAIGTTLYA